MTNRVVDIVRGQLSPEEVKLLESSEAYLFVVRCRMNAKAKVSEIKFVLFHYEGVSIKQEEFWMSLPMSRFSLGENGIPDFPAYFKNTADSCHYAAFLR